MRNKSFCLSILFLIYLIPFKIHSETENKPGVVLTNPVNSGLGAIFNSVIAALRLYDQGCYSGLKVDLNGGMYLDPDHGPNYWEYFFEPINLGNNSNSPYFFSSDDVLNLMNMGYQTSREAGYEMIKKYVRVKPKIEDKVKDFMEIFFKNYFVIGIHYRGTDKRLEAPIVPYHTPLFHVNWWMANLPKETQVRIFIATDDQNFLEFMQQQYPDKIICNYFVRSTTENPIHTNDHLYKNNYQKGEEAMIDLLLLSKCHLLLFPASSAFSMAATKFNPLQIAIPLQ